MSNLLRELTYPVIRDGKVVDVHVRPYGGRAKNRIRRDQTIIDHGGRRFLYEKSLPRVGGGATASTPPSQANAARDVLNQYLSIAPTRNYGIQGTLASGLSGGGNSTVQWAEQIPIIPAFCVAIDYDISFSVTLTLAAGDSYTVSPYAPYSIFSNQLTLGGAPPWPYTEFTPWHLDETVHRVGYDPAYPGAGLYTAAGVSTFTGTPAIAGIVDPGPSPINIDGASSLAPGATVSATGTYNFHFTVRQWMQRKRHLLWGAVPFGDPENRPTNRMQMNPLIGTNPEMSLFVNKAGTGSDTAVLASTCTINVNYRLSYIDLLPPSMNGQTPPAPAVGYGLQLTPSSPGPLTAGNIFKITHRTAQVYTSIWHLLINGEVPLRPDYYGLWDDQDQQSARWAFDSQDNTIQQYWTNYHRDYRRFPQLGTMVTEMDDGVYPEIASVTPYQALMTPDASYAQAWNIPVTPAMTTGIRIPSGTSTSNPYVREYEFGLVRVPY